MATKCSLYCRNGHFKAGNVFSAGQCKLCAQIWAQSNPEKVKRAQKKHNDAHAGIWAKANPEKRKAASKKYSDANKDKRKQRDIKNKDTRTKKNKKWKVKNKQEVYISNRRRISQIKSLDGHFSQEEWNDLVEKYDHKCLACGERKKLTIDHIVPISKGGSDLIENIQPLCLSCNSSKGTKTLDLRP